VIRLSGVATADLGGSRLEHLVFADDTDTEARSLLAVCVPGWHLGDSEIDVPDPYRQ